MAKSLPADAIALLKADHDEIEARFDAVAKARSRQQALAAEVCTALKIHTMVEEEVFYPAFTGKIPDDTINEVLIEHDSAKNLLNDILATLDDSELLATKVKVLCEETVHHFHEEEERGDGVFAQCRATDVDLVALRDAMLARKQELEEQARSAGLPPAELRIIKSAA